MQVFCGKLGTASEVGLGKRVIERKPLDKKPSVKSPFPNTQHT